MDASNPTFQNYFWFRKPPNSQESPALHVVCALPRIIRFYSAPSLLLSTCPLSVFKDREVLINAWYSTACNTARKLWALKLELQYKPGVPQITNCLICDRCLISQLRVGTTYALTYCSKSSWPDSNRWHADYKSAVLPTELQEHIEAVGIEPTSPTWVIDYLWRSVLLNYALRSAPAACGQTRWYGKMGSA